MGREPIGSETSGSSLVVIMQSPPLTSFAVGLTLQASLFEDSCCKKAMYNAVSPRRRNYPLAFYRPHFSTGSRPGVAPRCQPPAEDAPPASHPMSAGLAASGQRSRSAQMKMNDPCRFEKSACTSGL